MKKKLPYDVDRVVKLFQEQDGFTTCDSDCLSMSALEGAINLLIAREGQLAITSIAGSILEILSATVVMAVNLSRKRSI